MSSIIIEEVHKAYPQAAQEALRGVSLTMTEGQFVILSGRSGSGKTTLLNLIGALDRPTRGRVVVGGVDLGTASDDALAEFRRTSVGFVFQSFFLSPYRTALENVLLALSFGPDAVSNNQDRARQALQAVGLGNFVERRAAELSGGQRQRVALARALITRPAFLLADEPVGNLDIETRDEILELLLEYRQTRNATLLIVTHEDRLADAADRVIALEDGLLTSDATR